MALARLVIYQLDLWCSVYLCIWPLWAKNLAKRSLFLRQEKCLELLSKFLIQEKKTGWVLNTGAKEKLQEIVLFSGMSWCIWLDVMWWADLNNKCNQWHKKGYCLYACICDWMLLVLCVIWPLSVHFFNCLLVILQFILELSISVYKI